MFVPTPLWPETSRFRQTEKTGCVMSPWQFEVSFRSEMLAVYNTSHVTVIVFVTFFFFNVVKRSLVSHMVMFCCSFLC